MKKLKGLLAGLILSIGLLILAACGGKSSGISAKDVAMELSFINKNSATIKLTFSENDNISNGSATFYVMAYKYEDGEETSGLRQDVKFSGDKYTSSTVSFSSLTSDQEYHFVLFLTFNKSSKKILTIEGTTSTYVSEEIKTTDDFKNNLVNDTDGDFILTSDLDFSVDGTDETLSLFSSEAKAFMGTLDGGEYDDNGNLIKCHTIKNFKLSTSGTYNGLFGYLKNATIKNLIIESVSLEVTNKTTSNIGALAGYCEGSNIENVTVKSVSYVISTSSGTTTSEINTGGVVGFTKRSSFSNVVASNVYIEFTSVKTRITVGLFAGKISGDALKDNIVAKDCGASGILNIVGDFATSSSDTGYIYVGGFVGSLNASGAILDSYSEIEATYSNKRQDSRSFDLFIGGFVGANGLDSSMMYINNCLALVHSIKAFAGVLPESEDFDQTPYLSNYLSTNKSYVGGFIGRASGVFRGITDSYVFIPGNMEYYSAVDKDVKEDDVVIGVETVLFFGNYVGEYNGTNQDTYCNPHTIETTDAEAPANFTETLKDIVNKYLED